MISLINITIHVYISVTTRNRQLALGVVIVKRLAKHVMRI